MFPTAVVSGKLKTYVGNPDVTTLYNNTTNYTGCNDYCNMTHILSGKILTFYKQDKDFRVQKIILMKIRKSVIESILFEMTIDDC